MGQDGGKTKIRASAVDLFCGAGGLSHGLIKEGIPVIGGIDVDPDCKYPFEYNNKAKFICKSVGKLSGKNVAELYPKSHIKILVGCAPCQPFSTYTQRMDKSIDSRWNLLGSFARIVKEVKPEIVSMENVPHLIKHKIFNDFISTLHNLGYHTSHKEVFCPDYGIPQRRKRLVLLASLLGGIALIPPTHKQERYRTVHQTIGKLERIEAGEISKHDQLHRAMNLKEINMKRLIASKPGGTWKDWDDSLVAECHKAQSGKTYSSVYGRMSWGIPSPTITTLCFGFGNGRFGHPEQNRAISLREAALLQTFPKYYRFVKPQDPVTFSKIGRMIGNAVPVKLGKVIGRSILNHLKHHKSA